MTDADSHRDGWHAYRMHAFLLAYVPAVLICAGIWPAFWVQLVMGVLTFAVLGACAARVPRDLRAAVWICVPVATLFEIFGSLIWGGYRYHLGTIPAYVPPGHALVYVFGMTAPALPVVRRHGALARNVVLLLATAWAVAGLTVLPLATGRLDVQGALVWPILAWCILRTSRGDVFAGIWVAVTAIELFGTWFNDWTWAAVAPWSHLASGNPPSAIAGGYAVIDGTVLLVAAALLARRRRAVRSAAVERAAA